MAKDKDAKGKQNKSTGEASGSLSKGKSFKMPSKLLATPSISRQTVPKSKTFKKKATVKKTTSLLKSNKSALKSNKSALKSTKSALKSTKSALKSTKSALKSTKSALKSTKPALKSTKSALKSTKSALKSTKSALKSTKSALKSTKSFLKSGTKSALKVKSFSKAKSSNSKSLQTTKSSLKAKSSTKGKTFSKTKSFLKTNLKEKSAVNARSLLKNTTNAGKNPSNSKKSDASSPSAKTVTNTTPKSPLFADDKSTLEITAHSDVDDKPKSMVESPVLVVFDKTGPSNLNTTVKSNVDDAPNSAAEASIKSDKLETFKNGNPPNGQRKLKMKQKRKKVLGKSMGKSEKCESNGKTAGKEAFTVITSSCDHEDLFEVVIKSDVLDVSQQGKIKPKSDKPGTETIPEDGKTKKLAEKGQLKSSVDKQALLEVASATALAGVVTATQIVPPQVQLQERTLSETGQPENDDWEYSWEEVELPQYEYVFEYDYVEGKDVHKYDHKELLPVDEPLDAAPKVGAPLAKEPNVAVMATDAPKTDPIQEAVVHETVVPISLPQSGSLGNEKVCFDSHQPKASPGASKVAEKSSVQKEPTTKNPSDKTASEAPAVVATKYVSASETMPTQPDAVLLGSEAPTFAFVLPRVPSVTLKSSPSKEKVAQTKSPPKSPKAASEAPSQVPPVQLDPRSSSVASTLEPSENTNAESSSKNNEEKLSFKVKSIGTTPCGSVSETAHPSPPKETLPSIATEPKSLGSTKDISPLKPMVGSPSGKVCERVEETHLATSLPQPLSDNLDGVPKTESNQIGLTSNLPDGKLPAEKAEMEKSIAISDNSDKPTCAEKGVFMATVSNSQSESATSKSPERKGASDSTDSPKPFESNPQPVSKLMDTSPKSVQVEENAKEFSSLGQSSTPADTSKGLLPASEIPSPQNAAVTETILPKTRGKKSASPLPSSKQEDPMHKSQSGD